MKTTMLIPFSILEDAATCGANMIAIAQAAEAAGFDAVGLTDHPAPAAKWRLSGGHDALDPFAGLAFIAAATSRVMLHSNIVVLPYRNPFVTAKGFATLDVLSGGRAICGIASGYMAAEYQALGVDFASRGQAMDEALEVMKLAWSGDPVSYKGLNFTAEEVLPRPIPIQRPHPPIWAGGNGKRAVRRAAQQCNGWTPFFVGEKQAARNNTAPVGTIEDMGNLIAYCHEEIDRAGRSIPDFSICVSGPEYLTSTTTEARQPYLDQAGKLAGIGVTWTGLGPIGGSVPEYLDSIAWYGSEIIPTLRGI